MADIDSEVEVLKNITKWSKRQKLLTPLEEYYYVDLYKSERDVLSDKYTKMYAKFESELTPKQFKDFIKHTTIRNLLNPKSEDYSAIAKESMDTLVNKNLRLVLTYCKRSDPKHLTTYDLFVEGILGLIHAINKFDTNSGNKLSTYAVWWIRQSIQRSIQDKDRTIRIPIHIHDDINKLRKLYGEYSSNNFDSSPPDSTILARISGMDKKVVEKLGSYLHDIGSIDEENSVEEGSLTISHYLPAHSKYDADVDLEENADKAELRKLVDALPDEDMKFMYLYLGWADGIDRSVREMASVYQKKPKEIEKWLAAITDQLKETADSSKFNRS